MGGRQNLRSPNGGTWSGKSASGVYPLWHGVVNTAINRRCMRVLASTLVALRTVPLGNSLV